MPPPTSSGSFNGAAPARARNVRELEPTKLPTNVLQRGRARAGAECDQPTFAGSVIKLLQRGRARAGAECSLVSDSRHPAYSGLQRGRARAGAECARTLRRASTRPRCFNGAAPARARNALRLNSVGHVFRASTGPRPRGRGMANPASRRAAGDAALQRGRARAGAECGQAHGRPPRDRRFNGAAPARARNEGESLEVLGNMLMGFNGAAPARARNAAAAPLPASQAALQRGRARAGAE